MRKHPPGILLAGVVVLGSALTLIQHPCDSVSKNDIGGPRNYLAVCIQYFLPDTSRFTYREPIRLLVGSPSRRIARRSCPDARRRNRYPFACWVVG